MNIKIKFITSGLPNLDQEIEVDGMSETDWIVVKYDVSPAIQLCKRCGMTDNIPFGHSIDYVVDVLNAFIKAHRKCKVQ